MFYGLLLFYGFIITLLFNAMPKPASNVQTTI